MRGRRVAGTTARAADALDAARKRTGANVAGRLRTLVTTLDEPGEHGPVREVDDLVARSIELLTPPTPERIWLTLAVLTGVLPHSDDVILARRAAQLDGSAQVLVHAARLLGRRGADRRVSVVRDTTLVDLGDLVMSPLGTGIQRVARNVSVEWAARRDVVMTAWTPRFDALRTLDAAEQEAVLAGARRSEPGEPSRSGRHADVVDVVVPWHCRYVLPELAIDPSRCAATQAMAAFSTNRTAVIGFDCVPLTSSETSAEGFAGVFALNLAAVAHFDTVGAISGAAATEYEGWRSMLEGAGLQGPAIHAVGLPTHAPTPTSEAMAEAADRLLVPGLPLVLCVGSHEPRKNHLAVLHAAEVLWRRGLRFSLSFVGGHSWASEEFAQRLAELQGAGRPVESISRLPDRSLWAAYRLARFTVFPSVNEGFGLPVAESLASGTPAITSDFGSMREIAEDGGALLVDPRDDDALAEAMAVLLSDDLMLDRLRAQAAARPVEDWAGYADRLWELFHS